MFFTPVSARRALNGGAACAPSQASLAASAYAPVWRSSLLDEFFEPARVSTTQRGVRLERDDKGWQLSLDVPGLAREHLTITIDERVVRVESKADAPRTLKAAWEFAEDIDSAASSAKLENGVLELRLARREPVNTATVLQIG